MSHVHVITATKGTLWVPFRNTARLQRQSCCMLAILCVSFYTQIPYVLAASSWNPTLLVNTTATQVIDDMSSADLSLQFGSTLNKSLTYDRAASRFTFDAPLYIQGSLGVTGTMSGNALYVQRAFSGAGLTSCSNGTNDKLLWNSGTQQFSCGADQTGVGGGLTQTDGDARYVNQSGDTMTGALRINVTGGGINTLGLRVNNTASGAHIHAEQTLTSSGQLVVEGNLTFGDALADAITVNAGTWTFTNDTNFVLSGGNNGLSFDTNTLSIDASANRVGIGTTTPDTELETIGTMSGTSLTVGSLKNCDTIDTNGNGVLSCGTDAGGAGGISQTDGDARYVRKAGGTMTGALTIDLNGNNTGTGLILRERAYLGSGATLSGSLVFRERNVPERQGADLLAIYNREIANRSNLSSRNRNGPSVAFQPAFFSNNIAMVLPNVTTTTTPIGGGVTNSATLSHPTPTEALPYATNFATSTTSGNESGWIHTNTQFFRGSTAGFNGFFFKTRVIVIDTTLVRLFAGLSSQTSLANAFASDDVTGHRAGFRFSTVTSDTNWQVTLKDNTTQNLINSGVAVTANNVYDLTLYSPGNGSPDAGTMYWEITNLTSGTTARGSTASNLPGGSTALRGIFGVETQTTVAKNFRMVNFYVETEAIR